MFFVICSLCIVCNLFFVICDLSFLILPTSSTKVKWYDIVNTMHNYRKLFSFARPYYGWLAFSGVLMGVVTLFDMFRLSAIVPIIDRVFTNKEIVVTSQIPPFARGIVANLNSLDPASVLKIILIIMPIALLMRAAFEFLHSYIMSDVGQRVVRDVRNRIYGRLQVLSLDYFLGKRSGELVSRITNDVKLIENSVSYALTDLVYQTFEIVSCAVLAFIINWRLALMSCIVFPLIMFPIVKVGRVLRKISRRSQEKIADINSLLVETFQGVRIVRAFCAEDKEKARFMQQTHDYYRLTMKGVKRMLLVGIGTEFIGVAMALFVMYYSGTQVLHGTLSFGVFTLFMAALLSLIRPIKKLSQVNSIMQQAVAASDRIYEVLEAEVTVKERPDARPMPAFRDSILFDRINFSYPGHPVLVDISLEVKKGDIIAIVGPSGTGKSTLVDLLPRFHDPSPGRILIDTQDIASLTLASLRQQIGLVTQEVILFNDTIRGNIAYGKPGASEEEIEEAARQAHAHDFIVRLPDGYDTVIGDRGMKLSGGERQRIAIARALLKNPPILILDEATSQLDSESEKLVQAALDRLMQGRTVFMVAHRLSTVRNAHKIIVLDKGKIAEQGSHSELLNANGLYRRLYQMQELQ